VNQRTKSVIAGMTVRGAKCCDSRPSPAGARRWLCTVLRIASGSRLRVCYRDRMSRLRGLNVSHELRKATLKQFENPPCGREYRQLVSMQQGRERRRARQTRYERDQWRMLLRRRRPHIAGRTLRTPPPTARIIATSIATTTTPRPPCHETMCSRSGLTPG